MSSSYTLTAADAGSTLRVVADGVTFPPWGLQAVSPTYNKTSDNGSSVLTNWPNTTQGDQAFVSDGYQPQLVNDPGGSGRRVLALTTRNLSSYISQGGNSQRADSADWNHFQQFDIFTHGTEWWLLAEVYFPSVDVSSDGAVNLGHYIPMSGEWNWFYQWHYNSTIAIGGFPVELAMGIITTSSSDASNPKMFLDIRGGDVSGAVSYRDPDIITNRYTARSNIVYDHWYRILWHVKMSHASDGYLQQWIDGVLTIDQMLATVVPAPDGWTKFRLPSSGGYVSTTTEATQPNIYWRSATNYNDKLYPAVSNYHSSVTLGGTNTNNVVVLSRDWLAGPTRASVGG
jgi:hypothetical protein